MDISYNQDNSHSRNLRPDSSSELITIKISPLATAKTTYHDRKINNLMLESLAIGEKLITVKRTESFN